MSILFILLPLLTLLLGFTRIHSGYLYCGNMFFLWLLSGVNLFEVIYKGTTKKLDLGEIFRMGPNNELGINLGVYLDFYSSYMMWVVFSISFVVHCYSTVYMANDPRLYTFLTYLTLFTFFMVVLLVSPNYVQLFMGWEGVGLTSYLLVNFWTTRTAANKSALKAVLINRVGDLFFLWGLFLLIRQGQTLEFIHMEENSTVTNGVGVCFVAAAAAKSAQLGLHTWLPDAMEGPTPVSALIHAATMVTAGIFLLYRSTHYVEPIRNQLGLLGGLTALFAGTVALFQWDLKRVIAYSTCSQLGFMVVAYSLDAPELSLYHLGNHAFFKALLFLLAGLVIHSLQDEQDMRRMGGLVRVLPVTYTLFVVGSFALVGFPFLSGFYSKDSILEGLYGGGYIFLYYLCVGAAYLTAFYSFRVVSLVFWGLPRCSGRSTILSVTEADPLSLVVVTFLGGCSIFHGWLFREVFWGWGCPQGWSGSLVEAEFSTPLSLKLLPLVVSLFGALLGSTQKIPTLSLKWFTFFSKRWEWDLLDSSFSRRVLYKGYDLYLSVERGFFEVVGPGGIVFLLGRIYDFFRNRGWFTSWWLFLLVGFTLLGGVTAVFGCLCNPMSEMSATSGISLLPWIPCVNLLFYKRKVSQGTTLTDDWSDDTNP